jgi:pyrroline-5-carboxylate reductase
MTASKLSAASVLLVGAGKMGGAMLRGWVDRGLAHGIVIEPGGSALPDGSPKGLIQIASADQIPADFKADVVVLAVKPQVMEQVAPSFRRFSDAGAVIVSIAAGKTIAGFEKHYGAGAAIVRSMPNLPASIGQGITVACANAKASATQKELATELLGACGELPRTATIWQRVLERSAWHLGVHNANGQWVGFIRAKESDRLGDLCAELRRAGIDLDRQP